MALDIAVEVGIGLLVVCLIITYLIDALKKAGLVPDEGAGKANAILSTITVILVFILQSFGGVADPVGSVNEFALVAAAALATAIVTMAGTKFLHEFLKWLGVKTPNLG